MNFARSVGCWLVAAVLCAAVPSLCRAAEVSTFKKDFTRHEVRIGWGDMLFETLAFHDSPEHLWPDPEDISPLYSVLEKHHHTYTGHFFAEYQYSFLHWLSLGFQADFEGIFWQETTYDRFHEAVSGTSRSRNYNMALMPTLRFTFFRSQWVNLFAGLGGAVNIAFDNRHAVELAPAFHLNLLGMAVGNRNWFGTVELGLMGAMKNSRTIYMLGTRFMAVSFGYRF